MSFIIKNTNPFAVSKLTDIGRKKLAQGKLTFTAWGIGDSEINYDREEIVDAYPNDVKLSKSSVILKPVDRNPNIKHFVYKDNVNLVNLLNDTNIETIRGTIVNKADVRGFLMMEL